MTRLPVPNYGGILKPGQKLGLAEYRRRLQLALMQQPDPLTNAYQQMDQMARDETEQRYLDTLSGREGVRNRVTGDLDQWGQSMVDDTNRRSDISLKNQISDLTSRGLGASTIRSSITNAANRERNAELRRVNDDIINRRVNADERTSDAIYGLMERRSDVQPNPNQLAQLSQGLGQAGYGGGMLPGMPGNRMIGTPPRNNYYQLPVGGGAVPLSGGGGYGGGGYLPPATNTGPGSYYGGNTMYGQPQQRPVSYNAPGVGTNGLDSPMGNAVDRYGNRQQQMANMNAYGGMYGGGYGGMYGTDMLGPIGVGHRAGRDPMESMARSQTYSQMANQNRASAAAQQQAARNAAEMQKWNQMGWEDKARALGADASRSNQYEMYVASPTRDKSWDRSMGTQGMNGSMFQNWQQQFAGGPGSGYIQGPVSVFQQQPSEGSLATNSSWQSQVPTYSNNYSNNQYATRYDNAIRSPKALKRAVRRARPSFIGDINPSRNAYV